jgi:hypothetical protein
MLKCTHLQLIIFIIRVKVALPDISPEIHFVLFAFIARNEVLQTVK